MEDRLTVSEAAFEALCQVSGISFTRIPTKMGVQTPDYLLGEQEDPIVVEIKQLDPNEQEAKSMERLIMTGSGGALIGTPGKRAINKIKKAAKQIRSHSGANSSGLVVLYDNTGFGNLHVDPYDIKTAMYGIEQVVVGISPNPEEEMAINDQMFGKRRGVTPDCNTSVSAVAVIQKSGDGDLMLEVYHNCHCLNPIAPERLSGPRIRHFHLAEKVAGQFQEWEEMES